jgi:DNA-binding transcriptional LysR family regulator
VPDNAPITKWLGAVTALVSARTDCDRFGVTLTQLRAFVLVARLGSVRAAAELLGVSEPAVSRALSALRHRLGDELIVRTGNRMTLTAAGGRFFTIASQMEALREEAETAVRAGPAAGAPLRLVVTSTLAEFVAGPLLDAFSQRRAGTVDATSGVATTAQMRPLLANRLADAALGPRLAEAAGESGPRLVSEQVLRYEVVVVTASRSRPPGRASQWSWLVDPSGTDPDSDVSRLLRRLHVPEERVRVFPNQAAAWAAVAEGGGVAPAVAHLVGRQLRPGAPLSIVDTPYTPMDSGWYLTTPVPARQSDPVRWLRTFLTTHEATQLLHSPGAGLPPSRYRPPVPLLSA